MAKQPAAKVLGYARTFDSVSQSWKVKVHCGDQRPASIVIVHDGARELGRYKVADDGPLLGSTAALVLRLGPGSNAFAQDLLADMTTAEMMASATGPRPRRLVEDPACALEILGEVHPFSSCWRLRPDLGHFVVFTSLERDHEGRGVLRMGLEAQPYGGWAAFGLSHTRSMEGGEVAVVATEDRVPSGATISKFTLFAPLAERINAANGSFSVPGAVAERLPGEEWTDAA